MEILPRLIIDTLIDTPSSSSDYCFHINIKLVADDGLGAPSVPVLVSIVCAKVQ